MESAQSVSVDQLPPHALLFPFPMQGHIKPFMNLAKVLSTRGFYVTLVNTEFVQRRLVESGVLLRHDMGYKNHIDIRFETVPDGLPPEDGYSQNQNIPELCESMSANGHIYLHKLMEKLRHLPTVPPVTCIVSDGLLSKTQDIANEYGVPRVAFWTTSACGFMAYFSMPLLIDKGYLPLKGHLEGITGAPALKGSGMIRAYSVTDDKERRRHLQRLEKHDSCTFLGRDSGSPAIMIPTVVCSNEFIQAKWCRPGSSPCIFLFGVRIGFAFWEGKFQVAIADRSGSLILFRDRLETFYRRAELAYHTDMVMDHFLSSLLETP